MKYAAIAAAIIAGAAAAPVPAQPLAQGKTTAAAAAGPKTVLRFISDFESPPFSYKQGMKRVGFEVDIAEALAKELGATVEWIEMNFNMNNYAGALDRGSADAAIASISVTPDRQKQFSFTHAYYRASFAVAVKKGVEWEHNWFTSGLKGWRVGVMRGTTAERWAREHLSADIATYSSVDRLAQALKNSKGALKSGRAGFCVMHDEAILKWVLSDSDYRYEIVEKKIAKENYGIAVRKGNLKLLAELNEGLEKLNANTTYQKIRRKWYREAADLPLFEE